MRTTWSMQKMAQMERFRLKLFCVNPAANLGEYLKKGRSAVFFSATLLPMDYYRKAAKLQGRMTMGFM